MRTIEEIVVLGTRDERVFVLEHDFASFFAYYFSDFITFETPEFHRDMFEDCMDLAEGKLKYLMWEMFRESAKTSICKAFAIWCICYRKRRFINYDCYDKDNAEAALFDITFQLQTNVKLIADFGHLYRVSKKEKTGVSDMKRLNEFIANGIKVKAYSTQKSTRGRIFNRHRPDLYILDDFETETTIVSIPATIKVIKHVDTMKAGLAPGGWIIYLCNFITETGSVAHIKENMKQDPSARVREVPVILKDGSLAWPEKYVHTDKEAQEINKTIMNPEKHKVSLESKRKTLGNDVFETEMMNNPAASSNMFFDRATIDYLLKQAKPASREVARLKLWSDFNPKHRYAIGADTAQGVGKDSSATAIVDFDVRPNVCVGTYESNTITPYLFAFELKRQGGMFGNPLIAPEINNQGWSTVDTLKTIYPIGSIYRQLHKENALEKPTEKVGFKTTSGNKSAILYALKSAIEDGELVVFDEGLLMEMRMYTLSDLEQIEYAPGMTKHFDKLMALAIAWDMRSQVKTPDAARTITPQKPYTPMSKYEGR